MSNEEFIKKLDQGDLDLLENDLKTLFSGKIDPETETEILSNPDQKERVLGWWDAARVSGIKDKLLGKELELASLRQVVDNYLRNKKQVTTLPPEQAKYRVDFLKKILSKNQHPSVLELPEMMDLLVRLHLSENEAIDLVKETFGQELGIEDIELASYLKEIRSIDKYVDKQTFNTNQKVDLKIFMKNNVLPSVIKAKTIARNTNSKEVAEVIARVTAPNSLTSDPIYRTIVNYPYKDFYEQSVQTMFLNKHSDSSQITSIFQSVADYGIGKVKDKATKAIVQKFVTSEVGGKILSQLGIKAAAAATGTVLAPGVGTAVALVGGEIISKVQDIFTWAKIKIKEYAPAALMFAGATAGAVFALAFQLPVAAFAMGGGAAGYAIGSAGEAGSSLARGVNTLSAGLVDAVGTEIVWPMVIIIIATPIVIALILFIITNSALVVPFSGSEYYGNLFEDDGVPNKSSCPLSNPQISTYSYRPDKEIGHGSNQYWNYLYSADENKCNFTIPAGSGCKAPTMGTDNICYKKGLTQCDTYGFALDIVGSSTTLSLPQIDGKDVKWNFNGMEYKDAGAEVGWTYGYTDDSGKYSIQLKHVNKDMTKGSGLPSGMKIGSLFHQVGTNSSGKIYDNTHLHLEVQVDGRYVRPENYFCNK